MKGGSGRQVLSYDIVTSPSRPRKPRKPASTLFAVISEIFVLKNHAAARLFRARLFGKHENLTENTRIRDRVPQLKHLIFFALLDSARACEIRLDEQPVP